MLNKKVWLGLAGAAGVILAIWLFLRDNKVPQPAPGDIPIDRSIEQVTATGTPPATTTTSEKAAFLDALGKQLHEQWDARLANPYWRMKMLNDLLSLFQKKFGDQWQQELEAFLRATFPALADDLIKKMLALQEYNQWVEQLKSTLQFASMKDRQTALWDKRVALFGDEAYVIWEAAFKGEQLQAHLEDVNASTGTFGEKAQQYMNAMREVFGKEIIGPDKPHTAQMMSQFLQLQNVQADLQQLPETERYHQLRTFRRAMGLSEEALQRWDALDQERIAARNNGNLYLEQRATLESRYQGDALQSHLKKLQNELFGPAEAEFIRNEEASGYYRFNQPQIIGVN